METNAPEAKKPKIEPKTEPTTSGEDRQILDEFSRALKGAKNNAECYLWSDTTTPGMYIMPPALQEMRKGSSLTDVTLHVGPDDVAIEAHRVILAAFSGHFREAFEGAAVKQHVNVDFADLDSMRTVLDYFYTGQPVALTRENAPRLLILSNRLRSKDLKAACTNFIKKFINVKNCVKLMQIAEQRDLLDLLNECALFTVANLEKVIDSNFDFAQLSVNVVLQLIEHPAAVLSEKNPAENEKKMFMLVWNKIVLLSEEQKREAIPKLLRAIHLPQVDNESLADILEKVGDTPAANELFAKARQPIKPSERDYWYLPRYMTRGILKVASNPEQLRVKMETNAPKAKKPETEPTTSGKDGKGLNEVETYVYTPTILIKGYPWLVYVEKTKDKNIFHLENASDDDCKIENLGLSGKIVAQAAYRPKKKGAGDNFTIGPNIYHKNSAQKNPAEVATGSSCENLKLTITVKFEADSGSSDMSSILYSRNM